MMPPQLGICIYYKEGNDIVSVKRESGMLNFAIFPGRMLHGTTLYSDSWWSENHASQ